jgi:hypothetical protein
MTAEIDKLREVADACFVLGYTCGKNGIDLEAAKIMLGATFSAALSKATP